MNLGTVYLIVNDFEESVEFYEKLLGMPVSSRNMDRFAQFNGKNISIMNGHFDAEHPDKIVRKGGYDELFDDFRSKALAQNTHKFVLNFWVEDLQKEYERIRSLNLSKNLSKIKYIKNVSPYYYFCLTDPDGNIIEVTGNYSPKEGEFDE
ncbi:MAG: VOC family protein [Clostridiaceae bacterium]|nr:VOC family protein [Clostridiaceae bacterium]